MALTLDIAANELIGDIPKLSIFRAKACVQRAWHDIRDSRRWSFLVADGVLAAPAAVSTGTVTWTQYSNQVQGDANAMAAWNALTGVPITLRQIRVSGGPVYSISAYDDLTGIITLDRQYQEATAAGSTYIMYRCYFAAPVSDFLRWVSCTDPVNMYRFRRRNLHWKREEIDRRDPYRGATGQPFYLATYKHNAVGVPMFEMWPHPTAQISYLVTYERRGADLVAGETLPEAISDDLVMAGARINAYRWAAANAGRFQELQGTNWIQLARDERASYERDLQRSKVQDEETFPQNFSEDEDGPQLSGPTDSSYLQSHDVFWT